MVNISKIDLNLLVALDILLDECSVSLAAKRLHLTQPTVSGMLARLRILFDDPLFIRSRRGLVPTPKAIALKPKLKQLLADTRAIVNAEEFRPDKANFVFTIAANDYLQIALLVPFFEAVQKEAPNIRLAILPMAIENIARKLMHNEIDLAVTFPELLSDDLNSQELYEDNYVCAVRKKHPIKGKSTSVKRFCQFDHVIVAPSGRSFNGPMDQALAERGQQRRVVLRVPDFSVIPSALSTNDLIAIVPERFLSVIQHQLRTIRAPVEIPGFKVVAAWHSCTQNDPGHRWMRDLLARVASQSL